MAKKIGLIGVPNSGKTALAETLKTAIEMKDKAEGCKCRTPVQIIDNYVEDVEKESDLALGFSAGYLGNLHVALDRAARERKAYAKTVITCGTLLETSTYVAIDGIAQMEFDDDVQREDSIKRLESTMKTLACLYIDTFRYDHVFYLPPLVADGEKIAEMDRNLQVAFRAFNIVPVVPLVSEGEDILELTANRCTDALKVIFEENDEGNA